MSLPIHGVSTRLGIHASPRGAMRHAPMRWFKSHELMALRPFGVYCIVAGAAALLLMLA